MSAEEYDLNKFSDIEESLVDADTSFHSAKVRHLYGWWLSAGAGKPPLRQAFDIVDHRSIIGNIFLTEVGANGDFTFRLMGEAVIEMIGQNRTGAVVERGSQQPYGHALGAYYRRIVETGRCGRCVGSLTFTDKGPRKFESIDCPLSNDGEGVDMIIGVMDLIR